MQQDICNGTVSVCLSRSSTAAAACVWFAAMGSAGRISIDFCAADIGSLTHTCFRFVLRYFTSNIASLRSSVTNHR